MGHHEPEPEQAEEPKPEYQEQLVYEPPVPASFETSPPYESFAVAEDSPTESFGQSFEPIAESEPFQPSGTESEMASYANTPQEETENTPYDFSQTLDVTSEANFEAAQNVSDSSDFSDVTDFANADNTSGPISYTLTIEGIDTAKLTSDLKEAMMDSRFGWDVEEIFTKKNKDTLVLNSLSPAKASILVSRIKYLPLKISWRQDVLTGF